MYFGIFSVMFLIGFLFFVFSFSSSSLFREDWDAFQVEGSSESRRASILWELLSVWQCRWVSFWRKLLQPELCPAYQRQVGFCPVPSIQWVLESKVMVLGNTEAVRHWSPTHALYSPRDFAFRDMWMLTPLLPSCLIWAVLLKSYLHVQSLPL